MLDIVTLGMVILAFDRVTKLFITEYFTIGESIKVSSFFNCTFVLNKGGAFGLLNGQQWLFFIIGTGVLIGIWYFRADIIKQDIYTRMAIACLGAGTFGNLIDRIMFGAVIDFIDFIIWPIFNIADTSICFGMGLLFWSILWIDRKKKLS